MDQAEAIDRLAGGEPFDGRVPERIDTHISVVFLTGDRAYKMKRAARTSYLDYRDLDDRKRGSEREVTLNRRTAPELYLRTVPLTEAADGRLVIGGDGRVVEWLVEMKRFDPQATFDVLALGGELESDFLVKLADQVARLHRDAAVIDPSHFPATIERVIAGNADELTDTGEALFGAAAIAQLTRQHTDLCRALAPTIAQRARDARIRECHGDLHLGNICLFEGEPRIFDAIEFNEEFNRIDTLYDLGFLLMDLATRGDAAAANLVFNRYMQRLPDFGGLRVLPFYQSIRAAIRAHVMAKSGERQSPPDKRRYSIDLAKDYFGAAVSLLAPPQPRLVAIGGYSGTGKTTLANRIAPTIDIAPGAVVLSSDIIRKRHFAVEPENRLGPRMYRADVSRVIYREIYELAGRILAEGRSVIADATFMDADARAEIEDVAASLSAPFDGFWLTGDSKALAERIAARPQGASDATPGVLKHQLAQGPGDLRWRSVDTTSTGDGGFGVVQDELRRPGIDR